MLCSPRDFLVVFAILSTLAPFAWLAEPLSAAERKPNFIYVFTDDHLVLNVDPAPTFLDLAGVPIPAAMHGRSWKSLLAGASDVPWRESFFYCYFFERGFATPTTTAVRTTGAKLIKYPGHDDWTELFDLRADPYETKNLANDSAHAELRRSLEAEYDRQARAIGFQIPPFADMPPADGSLPAPTKNNTKQKQSAKKKAKGD